MCAYVATMWLLVTLRLFLYQRHGSKFRFFMSTVAWAMMVGSFARAVEVAVAHSQTSWAEAFLATAIAIITYRAKGNVACLLSRTV